MENGLRLVVVYSAPRRSGLQHPGTSVGVPVASCGRLYVAAWIRLGLAP